MLGGSTHLTVSPVQRWHWPCVSGRYTSSATQHTKLIHFQNKKLSYR